MCVDYIKNVSNNMYHLLMLHDDQVSITSLNDYLAIAYGFSCYSDYHKEVENGLLVDWKLMLSPEYSARLEYLLHSAYSLIPENILKISTWIMSKDIMSSVPVTFRLSTVLLHDFMLEDDYESWKKQRKELVNDILIPLIVSSELDLVHSLAEFYGFLDLDLIYKKLLDSDDFKKNINSKLMRFFTQRSNVIDHQFLTEDAYMQWSFLIMPFLDTENVFNFILENNISTP